MLLKHSAQYLLARGLPGLINFLAIAIYTRMLSPTEYGQYALLIAGLGFLNVILFQWSNLSLLRFLPIYLDNPRPLLSTILGAFLTLILLTGFLGILLEWLWPEPEWKGLIMLGVPLLWAQAWFELNLQLCAAKLLPLRYGLMNGIKTVSGLVTGVVLIKWGLGEYGPLIGLLIGLSVASIIWGRVDWRGLSLTISRPLLNELLRYSLPLAATFALTFVISSSDRFFIAWFFGEGPAGIYSASYDLGQQTLTMMMMVISLAGYPLAIRALEESGVDAAHEQLLQNATLLLAIALPTAVGIAALADNISAVMLGGSFREDAAYILPWVVMAILLSGVRSYYFDLAFYLGKHTRGMIQIAVASALLNVFLNLWWIPKYGLIGAAYATFGAYFLALILSATLGRRIFMMPIPYLDGIKIAFASLMMGLMLEFWPDYQGFYSLAAKILLGGSFYLILLSLLNVHECRNRFLQIIIGWEMKRN